MKHATKAAMKNSHRSKRACMETKTEKKNYDFSRLTEKRQPQLCGQ